MWHWILKSLLIAIMTAKNLTRLLAMFSVLFCIFAQPAWSQQRTVTGKVTDAKSGIGIQGVSVTVKGTQSGTTSLSDGTFSLRVPENTQTLIFSSIGYGVKEVDIRDQPVVNVVLESLSTNFDEVVVVGYGTQRRREVTGAISKVGGDKITAIPAPSFEAALQGKAPGVQVIQGSGLAGSGSVIRIRGIGSISAGGDPLYVVDGIPITADPFLRGFDNGMNVNPLAAINPNDIESIEILKDAGAAGIYGSRGANGVVLITTKRGKSGKPVFNYSNKIGVVTYTEKPDMVNSTEYMQLLQEAWENDGNTGQVLPKEIPGNLSYADAIKNNTDWWDLVTRKGLINEHNLSMSQGTNKFRSFVGATYSHNESYIVRNFYDRMALRANLDYKVTDKFKVSLNAAYNKGINNRVSIFETVSAAASDAVPIFPVYNANGSYFKSGKNPQRYLNETRYRNTDNRYLGGLTLEYSPIKNLTLKAVGSIDYLVSYDDQWESAEWTGNSNGSIAKRYPIWLTNYTTTYTANYLWNMNDKNKFAFLLGAETQESKTKNTNGDIYAWGLEGPYYDGHEGVYKDSLNMYLNNGSRRKQVADNWTFNSVFARINYTLDNKYVFQALGRVDGSSRFGSNKKRGFFPAVSAAWILSEEDFIRNIPQIDNLKLRASYGIVGNANFPAGQYYFGYSNPNNYNGTQIWQPNNLGNPDLHWETLRNFDLGLDFSFNKGGLTGELAYYRKITVDQLLYGGVGASMGFTGQWRNLDGGKILNEGVELSLNLKLVDKDDWKFSIGGNISKNVNEVLTLGTLGPDALQGGYNDTRIAAGYPVGTNLLVRYVGPDPADGLPIWLDKNGKQTKTFNLDHRVLVGKVLPDYMGGVNTNLSYKNIQLTTLWTYVIGGNLYDGSAKYMNVGNGWNVRREMLDRWTKPGDIAKFPRYTTSVTSYPGLGTNDNYNSTMFLYDADYLRLREITLSYRFNRSLLVKTFIKDARISLTGMNLLTFSKFPGGDPEIARDFRDAQDRNMSPNVTYLTPPQSKSLMVSLNLNF